MINRQHTPKLCECKNCGKVFDLCVVDEYGYIVSRYSRSYCFECAPENSGNGSRFAHKHKYKEDNGVLFRQCSMCNKFKEINEANFLITNTRKLNACKNCQYQHNNRKYQKRKQELVDLKVGECQICGYKNCIGALDFHHLDPSQKDQQFNNFTRLRGDALTNELGKCVLVCVRCHREIHAGLHPEFIKNHGSYSLASLTPDIHSTS